MDIHTFEDMFKQGQYHFTNKAKTYLAPVMNAYGDEFRNKMRLLSTVAVGIDDVLCSLKGDYYLFFLINVQKSNKKGIQDFNQLLAEFQELNFYVHDYPFGKLLGGHLHMLVFKVPEEYYYAYDVFCNFKQLDDEGKCFPVRYSRMYTEDDIKNLFIKLYGENTRAVRVFRQDPKYKEQFEERLNRIGIFASKYGNVEWLELPEGAELEFIPNPEEEIFNYRQ